MPAEQYLLDGDGQSPTFFLIESAATNGSRRIKIGMKQGRNEL
jgi:hypothetical protein